MSVGIKNCRICSNNRLVPVLDLGVQKLTGVFPADKGEEVASGPLRLVKCYGGDDVCGLLQLEHSYDGSLMYGENYGYRSGLNASMVRHLQEKVSRIQKQTEVKAYDLIIDIGSNDATTLSAYETGPQLVGIDPTGMKFKSYYPSHVRLIPDFFSAALFEKYFPGRKAKIVTSFSMFYDLDDPVEFMTDVHRVLADDGIWVFEQSYMPTMLEMNSYDTVCHEHLEYYALKQIVWMADRVGFSIIDVEFNDINGGSFSVTAEKAGSPNQHAASVYRILNQEKALELDAIKTYQDFAERALEARAMLLKFIGEVKANGQSICALGASTKGNVLLQYCGVTESEIPLVGEVNADKFGHYTPGSNIPIVSEDKLLEMKPDFLLVLPWHFKEFFLEADKFRDTKLVFPLPTLEVI